MPLASGPGDSGLRARAAAAKQLAPADCHRLLLAEHCEGAVGGRVFWSAEADGLLTVSGCKRLASGWNS